MDSPDELALHVGGLPCLELVNTRPRSDSGRRDVLAGFDDLISWLCAIGVTEAADARRDLGRWGGTAEAERTVAAARELRDALGEVVAAIVDARPIPSSGIARINEVLAARPGVQQLGMEGDGYAVRLRPLGDEPIHLLAPIAESAADLLAHGDLSLLRRCENPACVLCFYDRTRNRSRRWCSMELCGSRIKAAAYYRRKRGQPG